MIYPTFTALNGPMSEIRPSSARLLSRSLPSLAFAALVLVVWADPLFFRRNFAGRDLVGYNLPIEKLVHDAYQRGRLPVWNDSISGGRPLLPNPNAGALYPVRPLLALVPFPAAMRLFPVLHWILSGVGLIVLLRSLGTSRVAAFAGAVTYVFSGVGISAQIYTNHHPGVMLLPWIVWAVRRDDAGPRKAALLGLLFGLDMLAGDVFTIGLALVAAIVWILFEIERSRRLREAFVLGGGLALALLLAAPQIVATLLWVPETNRAVLGMKIGEVVLFSISPFRLLELLVPFPFGPTWDIDGAVLWSYPLYHYKALGFYATLYAGALAVLGLVSSWKQRARGVRFAQVFFLFCLALSVPPSLLEGAWIQLPSPVPLRYPEKFAVGLIFALAVLAGLFVDRVRRGERPPRWALAVAVALTLIAVLTRFLPDASGRFAVRLIGADPDLASHAAASLAPSFAEGGLAWVATVVALEGVRSRRLLAAGAGLLLLSAAVVGANKKIAMTFSEDAIFMPTAFARFVTCSDPAGSYRVLGSPFFGSSVDVVDQGSLAYFRQGWSYYTPALWGRATIFNLDFDNGDLSRLASLRHVEAQAAQYRDAGAFFGGLSLRWATRPHDREPLAGYHALRWLGLEEWDEHARPLPDVRLVEAWGELPNALAALGSLGSLPPGAIVVESGAHRQAFARPGTVTVLQRSPERLLLDVEAPDPTWLFVLRGFWSHRTILIDGRPVRDAPAQIAFSAVPVPPGRHRVEWREEVPGLAMARWGPVLFGLAGAWLCLRGRKQAA